VVIADGVGRLAGCAGGQLWWLCEQDEGKMGKAGRSVCLQHARIRAANVYSGLLPRSAAAWCYTPKSLNDIWGRLEGGSVEGVLRIMRNKPPTHKLYTLVYSMFILCYKS
jgi:hypothetical protein